MSQLDDNHALITADECTAMLGVSGALDTNELSRVERLINAASLLIEQKTGRLFLKPASAVTEYFHGTGTKEYLVKNAPIITDPAAPTDLQYMVSSTSWLDTTGTWIYTTDDSAIIEFTDGAKFSKASDNTGRGNWRITYNYGYDGVANIPDDLKIATASIVGIMKKQFETNLHAVVSMSSQMLTTRYNWELTPKHVIVLINKYKRRYFG